MTQGWVEEPYRGMGHRPQVRSPVQWAEVLDGRLPVGPQRLSIASESDGQLLNRPARGYALGDELLDESRDRLFRHAIGAIGPSR